MPSGAMMLKRMALSIPAVLANISRDRSRTCGSRIHSGLREKCPQIVAHRSLPGSRSRFTTEAGSD